MQQDNAQRKSQHITNREMAWPCLGGIPNVSCAGDSLGGVAYKIGGLPMWQARRALSYIESNLGSKINIAEIAALAGLSKSYFSRAFKLTLGASPMAYVSMKRIERAKALIVSSTHRLSAIALECGFADQSHLNRKFCRCVGMSPGSWRRSAATQSAG